MSVALRTPASIRPRRLRNKMQPIARTWHETVRGVVAVCSVALAVSFARGAGAGNPASNQPITQLPPFLVSASEQIEWYYLETPAAVILSSCPDSLTREFAAALQQLETTLGSILPSRYLHRPDTPEVIVLINDRDVIAGRDRLMEDLIELETKRGLQQTARAELQRSLDKALRSVAVPFDGRILGVVEFGNPPAADVGEGRRYGFLPNLHLADRDRLATFSVIRESTFDAAGLTLSPDNIRRRLQQRRPLLPPWFVEAFARFYETGAMNGRTFVVPRSEWSSPQDFRQLQYEAKHWPNPEQIPAGGVFLGMAHLFHAAPPADPDLARQYYRRRHAQQVLFIRWCLDPKVGRREQLWQLVGRSTAQPVTEPMFRECFGLSYVHAEAQLRTHLIQRAALRRTEWSSPAAAPKVERPARATKAEIARVLGEWERLLLPHVRKEYPELTAKYEAQARRTLYRGYKDGDRDPRLLASIGLFEAAVGNDADARPLLKAAADARLPQPSVYYELARIRLAAHPADTPLDASGLVDVLEPLFAARGFSPPLPEVYELIAKAWDRTLVAPTRAHLAVLEEGVRLFPDEPRLVVAAAELHAKHGFHAEAAALARSGLVLVKDSGPRAKLESLLAALRM